MKKKMMSLVAVGLAVSMLAGCGNAGTSGDESSGGGRKQHSEEQGLIGRGERGILRGRGGERRGVGQCQ